MAPPAVEVPCLRPLRVGLTGGIASGKSTVAGWLATWGAPIIDTDRLAREVVEPGTEGLEAIAETFGQEVLTPGGRLDRAALGQRVFHDDQARARLEAILHPRIQQRLTLRLQGIDAPYAVAVVPLLIESGMDQDMDTIIAVDLPPALQQDRLMARDGITAAEAQARLAAQAPAERRREAADYIIDNRAEPAALARRVADLHRRLLAAARRAPHQA